MNPTSELCEWEGCQARATWWSTYHWTIFDFIDVQGCEQHRQDIGDRFWNHLIDGQPPADETFHVIDWMGQHGPTT